MKLKCPEWMNPTQMLAFYDSPENAKHYLYGARGGWVKDKRNPVLTDKYGVLFDVSVIHEHNIFKMWLSWRTKSSIAYCESKDGIVWTDPVVVLQPVKGSDWEGDEVNRPTVIKSDGLYKMWYSGQMQPGTEAGCGSIGYAESEDGISWFRPYKHPVMSYTQPWEEHSILCPHVLYDQESKRYKLWYAGGSNYEPDAIGYAESEDGISWVKNAANPILEKSPVHLWEQYKVVGPHVLKHKDWYYMFYIGHLHAERASIGLARSKDGISGWEKHPANPIIAPDKTGWDSLSIFKPYVLRVGDRWMLWYNGAKFDKDIWVVEQIGVAYLESDDFGF